MIVARVCLDINVFFAALRGKMKRLTPSAASELVEMALSGQAGESGFQLITSVPLLEAWANSLQRYFDYSRMDAETQAGILHTVASDGPLQISPVLPVGAGFVPYATEQDVLKAAERFARQLDLLAPSQTPPLFDEIADDRHVLLTALAGRADLLVTTNMRDFQIRKAIQFTRDDVLVIPTADHTVVVSKPSFAVSYLRRGVCPTWSLLQEQADQLELVIDVTKTEQSTPFLPLRIPLNRA